MPGRFTSNKQIIKSSPELFRGVQALSNSLVAKEQITAIQNQRDIDNFESLIDISSKGILAGDQQEITSSIDTFRKDAIAKGIKADGSLGLNDLQDLKQRRTEIEGNVALSQKYMKDYNDIIKLVGKDKTGSFDIPAMTEAFAKWGSQPIGDRVDPWSLVKLNPTFTIPEYLGDNLSQNVAKSGERFAGGFERTETYNPAAEIENLYHGDKQFKQRVDDEFALEKERLGEDFKFENETDYLIKTYGPQFTVDNTIPTFFKATKGSENKAPVAIKRSKDGSWKFGDNPLKFQSGSGRYFTVDGKEHEITNESFKNSEFTDIVSVKLPDDESEQLYVVMQVPKVNKIEKPTDEELAKMSPTEKLASLMSGAGSSKTDQQKMDQVLVPYDDVKEMMDRNFKFEGLDEFITTSKKEASATKAKSQFDKYKRK